MLTFGDSLDLLPQWLSSAHLPLAIFVGTLLGGEMAVLAGVLLATAGAMSVPALFAVSLLGALVSDLVWFRFGERLARLGGRWRAVERRFERTLASIDRFDPEASCRYLLVFKFVYGIRIVTIVFTSMRRVPLGRFLFLDGVGSAAYLVVLIGAGLVLCRNAVELAPAAQTLRYAVAAVVALTVLSQLGTRWFRARLLAR